VLRFDGLLMDACFRVGEANKDIKQPKQKRESFGGKQIKLQ
jgi:hypothetical protein